MRKPEQRLGRKLVRKILHAAEKVFAIEGYRGATIGKIASAADVDLSLVVHHFGTKDDLYYRIFENRQYINEQRLARLHAMNEPAGLDAVDDIVSALSAPVLALHNDPGDVWFARLLLGEASEPSSPGREVISSLFDPMAREFVAAPKTALPNKKPGFPECAYLFSMGALTQSAFDARTTRLARTNWLGQPEADAPPLYHRRSAVRLSPKPGKRKEIRADPRCSRPSPSALGHGRIHRLTFSRPPGGGRRTPESGRKISNTCPPRAHSKPSDGELDSVGLESAEVC